MGPNPSKKSKFGHRQAHTHRDPVRTQREDSHLQTKERDRSQEKPTLPTPRSGTSSLQDCETIDGCHLSPHSLWYFVTAALAH